MKTPFIYPIFLYCCFCFGQQPDLSFHQIGTEQGLSQSYVHSLCKDQNGFIWVGTQDGLNRYDSYGFDRFYKDPSNPTSLANNYIWDIIQSKVGQIWVGTNGGGLSRFDPKTDQFYNYTPQADFSQARGENSIRVLIELGQSNLLVGTDKGLYSFHTQNEFWQKIPFPAQIENHDKRIFAFCRLDEEHVLVGGLGIIMLYNEATKELSLLKLSQQIDGGFHSILKESETTFWLASGKGLVQLQWQAAHDSLVINAHFRAEDTNPRNITSNYISTLFLDKNDRLWIGTDHGLNFLNINDLEAGFTVYTNDPNHPSSLSNNTIFDLLEVEDNILWAATHQGINQFNISPPVFNSLPLSAGDCGSSIHGMAVSASGHILACSEKGLLILSISEDNKGLSQVNCYNQTNLPQMADEFLVNVTKGRADHYWVALRRGGFAKLKFDQESINWEGIKLPAGNYSNVGTNGFWEEPDGKLWIASSGLGLWLWDPTTDTYQSFAKSDSTGLSGNYIFNFKEDSQGRFWVITADGGLCQMDRSSQKFNCFTHDKNQDNSISNNLVLSVFEDSQQRLWVSTSNGLNLYLGEGQFQRFYQKDGLPNNVIYGLLEDANQHLWVSTNQGLAQIDYQDGKLTCKSFHSEDGLLNDEFNQHAFLALSQGQMLFGSEDGLSFFDPLSIQAYSQKPQLVVTDFKLFNESVPISPQNDSSVFTLKQHINASEQITLKHSQNFLAFEFSGINFDQSHRNQYAYQLEGLDQDWVYAEQRRFANYPDLKPGNYTFKLKAANHDGIWTDDIKSINITVLRPPWATWWAYCLYLLAAFGIIYAIFQYRLRTIRLIEETKEQERVRFRQRSARDFHDEAGNQITKISLITEIAKRQAQDNHKLKDLISQIEDNVQGLRSGMRDFIWVLDPGNDNLYETLLRLKTFANGIFEFSPILFSTSGIEESLSSIKLNANLRRHLLLIFKEAINNTLKYSEAKHAKFTVKRKGNQIEMKFADDGQGFSIDQAQGNGLNNIKTRASKIGVQHQLNTGQGQGVSHHIFLNITQMGN